MKKKVLATLISVAMVASLLVGCGAKEEAAAIINQARIEAQLEKQKAADDMKKEMISIASLLAGKVTAGAIDTSIQDSLVEETLKEIGETTWQS